MSLPPVTGVRTGAAVVVVAAGAAPVVEVVVLMSVTTGCLTVVVVTAGAGALSSLKPLPIAVTVPLYEAIAFFSP